MRSLKDIKTWFKQPAVGSCETAIAPWWRLIPVLVPNIKILVVRRPVNEVVGSLLNICPIFNESVLYESMIYMDRKLGQLAKRLPNVMQVTFEDLNKEEVCKEIFEFLLEQPFDREHWLKLKDQNIQINFMGMVRYAQAFEDQLRKLGRQATNKIRADLALKRNRVVPSEGFVIQKEPFDVFLRDGIHLFEQHCIEVGEEPDEWQKKNLPLMKYFDDNGLLQVMVARQNGKMFGYLMTIINPSFEDTTSTLATHTTRYADPSFPGLGLKLERAADMNLKLGGVNKVFMQTGVRGDGDRLDTIYRRIGAEPVGELYRLDLKEAI